MSNIYANDIHLLTEYFNNLQTYDPSIRRKLNNGNFILLLIQIRGLKQEYVANRLKVSKRTLIRLSQNPTHFTLDQIIILTDVLRCSFKMFMFYCLGFRLPTDKDKAADIWQVKGLKLQDFDELIKLE